MPIYFSDKLDELPAGSKPAGFRTLNPVFYVSLATLVISGLAAGRVLPAAFYSAPDSNATPIALFASNGGFWLLASPLAVIAALWLISGLAVHRGAQILLSIAACAASAFLIGMLYFSVFAAGLRH